MFVFVYGTLKIGQGNHSLIKEIGGVCIKTGITNEPKFDLVDLGAFPGLIPGSFYVYGEYYEIKDEMIKHLDWLEGHPSFYCRKRIKMTPWIKAETYFLVNYKSKKIVETFFMPTIKIWER